jgi:hypothetical protein
MFNEAADAMKFDNRLRARRDWVSDAELEQELATLPDSADKVLAEGEEPEVKPSAESVAPPTPEAPVIEEPVAAEPEPTATFGGGFSDPVASIDAAESSESLEAPPVTAATDTPDNGGGFGGTHNA